MSATPRTPSPKRRRTNRRYDKEPMRRVALRGTVFLLLFVTFAYVAMSTYNGVPGRSYDHVEATVPRTGNLIVHDPVRIGGRRAGQVERISAAADGQARLRLQLQKGNDLPADSKIMLRSDGLLGARYVELVPGHATRKLAAGEVIRGGARSLTYGVTDALDTFDRQTRADLGTMIGELGKGTLGHGPTLNDAFRRGADAIGPFDGMLRVLRAQPQANQALLPSLDGAVAVLDANRRPLGRLFEVGATALRPFVDDRDAVHDALAEAPGTLTAADAGLGRARSLLHAARSLASEANATLPRAPGGLRALTALLRESPQPLSRTTTLLKSADAAIPATLKITSGAAPLLRPLHELLSDSDNIVNTLAPYGCDFENFGAVFRSMTGMGGNGEGPNGPAMAFRLQVIAPVPAEGLSMKDTTGLLHREGYSPPCKFLSGRYPSVTRPRP
jgi:virulence factor Mce-like protein